MIALGQVVFQWVIAIPSIISEHFGRFSENVILCSKTDQRMLGNGIRIPQNARGQMPDHHRKYVWCSLPPGNRSGRSSTALGLDYPPTKNGVSKCQKLIKDISKMPLEMKKNLLDGPRSIFPRSRETISNTVYRQLAQLLLVVEQTNFPCPDRGQGVRCGELYPPCHRPDSIISGQENKKSH